MHSNKVQDIQVAVFPPLDLVSEFPFLDVIGESLLPKVVCVEAICLMSET